MSEHFVSVCDAGHVVTQCRCPSPNKAVRKAGPCRCGPHATVYKPRVDSRTHWEGCWRSSDHHECTLARLEDMWEENGKLVKDVHNLISEIIVLNARAEELDEQLSKQIIKWGINFTCNKCGEVETTRSLALVDELAAIRNAVIEEMAGVTPCVMGAPQEFSNGYDRGVQDMKRMIRAHLPNPITSKRKV